MDLLNKMPISMQTLSVRQKKNLLEDKLLEIDKSIAILSNKNIFIKEWAQAYLYALDYI